MSEIPSDTKFTFINIVGNGTYGYVKLVHDTNNNKFCIKSLGKEIFNSENKEKFEEELEKIKNINHINIVKCYKYYKCTELYNFVFEYVPNCNLKTYLKNIPSNKLDEKQSFNIAYQISCGLNYLHDLGYPHLDIKPTNIIFTSINPIGVVKISDFGFYQLISHKMNPSITTTPHYKSPEVLQMKDMCLASDVWSLDCILFYMVLGDHPFKCEREEDLLKNIHSNALEYPPSFSDELKNLLKEIIKINPSERPNIKIVLNKLDLLVNSSPDKINEKVDVEKKSLTEIQSENKQEEIRSETKQENIQTVVSGDTYYNLAIENKKLNQNEEMIKNLEEAIKLNHVESMFLLGKYYKDCKLFDKMVIYFNLASENNNALASYALGVYYQHHSKDEPLMSKFYKKSIDLKYSEAAYAYGLYKKNNNKIDGMIKYFKLAAQLGNPKAMFSLGLHYQLNNAFDKMLTYYKNALELNHIKSINNLGYFYQENNCHEEMMKYYKMAENLGSKNAEHNIILYNRNKNKST